MNKYIGILFLSLLTAVLTAQSQAVYVSDSKSKLWEVGIMGAMTQYRGEYNGIQSAFSNKDFNIGYGAVVRYNFNLTYDHGKMAQWFDSRGSLRMNILQFHANSTPSVKEDAKFLINELSLLAEYNLTGKFSGVDCFDNAELKRWGIYANGGFAGLLHKADYSNITINGNQENKFSLALAAGLGMKFAVTPTSTLAVEGGVRYTLSDNIDLVPNTVKINDLYWFVGVNMSFNIGQIFGK